MMLTQAETECLRAGECNSGYLWGFSRTNFIYKCAKRMPLFDKMTNTGRAESVAHLNRMGRLR